MYHIQQEYERETIAISWKPWTKFKKRIKNHYFRLFKLKFLPWKWEFNVLNSSNLWTPPHSTLKQNNMFCFFVFFLPQWVKSVKWLIHIFLSCLSFQVIQGLTSNGCTLWRYLQNVLCIASYSFYRWHFSFLFLSFYSELYLIDGMIDTAQRLKSWCCLRNEGAAWMYRSSWSAVWCVCSGAWGRTVDTDGEEDRSDLTWQDVLWHDMLIWQKIQALLCWTNPTT